MSEADDIRITASTPMSPLLAQPGMQHVLENGWDPYLIQKKHMVADRHDKSARWLPDLKSSLKAKRRKNGKRKTKSKRIPFRSGRSLFKHLTGGRNRTSPGLHRRAQTSMPKSFLQRTGQGPILASDTLSVMRRIETYRLQKKNEAEAAVKIQSAFRDFAGIIPPPAAAQTNSKSQQSPSAAANAPRTRTKGQPPRKPGVFTQSRRKKRKKKVKAESPKESKQERVRREWMETFRLKRRAEKAAERKARRDIRRAEKEADNAAQEREKFLVNLRQSLADSTVHYHNLYNRTLQKVRDELVAAGHEAAATKMQSVLRMQLARKQLANKEAMAKLTEEDLALLEAIYGTRNLSDVDPEKIQSDLKEARESLMKIQATVRGRISREEVLALRQKLREDAAGKFLKAGKKAGKAKKRLTADDNFMLMAMYDDDMTNTLDAEELRNFLADLGMPSSEESIKALMAKMDRDGNGTVDFHELLHTLPPHIQDRLRTAGYTIE